ncbi:serine protease [Amylibacter marinus]|uniref:Serine protease n=2 Tax=Amylibacter marinus TaxID=1475483 RepID=A0ABQ5VT47_9RHOB|nr:serine protease [Amylibacter marinus]
MTPIARTKKLYVDQLPIYLNATLMAIMLWIASAISSHARGAPDSFADLAERLSPSVVNITTSTTVVGRSGENRPQVPEGSPFGDLFDDFFNEGPNTGPSRPRRSSALGSGFVISADGFIVTNNHVIDKADEITIEFFDGTKRDAKLIGRDAKTDVAVLKVEAEEPLPFVAFGDSDIARVGDWVMAIGNPLGQGFSVSAGIISARNRSLRSGPYDDYIQTDAAINRGNSGGPLFNMDGDVIGVNTAIISPNGGSIGLGFSMSSKVVSRVVQQLQEFGETRRGWLGVQIQDIDSDMASALGLDSAKGAIVSGVPAGPGADAGILAGDVILTFDGVDVVGTRELVAAVGNAEVGKAVRVVIYRDGKTQTLLVTLGRREDAEKAEVTPVVAKPEETPADVTEKGMKLAPISDSLKEQYNIDGSVEGVVVIDVDETSDAFVKGIRVGDVIQKIAQEPVTSPEQVTKAFADVVAAGRKSVLMLVARGGNARFVGLVLAE